jgi:hypothetical protein
MKLPQPPGRTAARPLAANPHSLENQSEAEVLSRLGRPSRRERGNAWPSQRLGQNWISVQGDLRELPTFGPAPPPLAKGEPYVNWIYNNVALPGSAEPYAVILCLAGRRGSRRVVAVRSYPLGAVS